MFEGDYKGFFDNINIDFVTETLEHYKVPREIVTLIESLNRSLPKLAEKDLIEETDRIPLLTGTGEINPNEKDTEHYLSNCEVLEDRAAYASAFAEFAFVEGWGRKSHGLPQGAPTSPFLSILALDLAVKRDRMGYKPRVSPPSGPEKEANLFEEISKGYARGAHIVFELEGSAPVFETSEGPREYPMYYEKEGDVIPEG